MRWIWIDRFVEFESGVQAKTLKNISLAEEHLHDHFPGFPVMPHSLIIEGLAQTGGILLGESHQFKHMVILAKVPKMTFHSWAVPGDTLVYHAKLTEARDEGGMVEVTAHIGDRLVAEGEIVFAHVPQQADGPQASQRNAVFDSVLMTAMEVGKLGESSSALSPTE